MQNKTNTAYSLCLFNQPIYDSFHTPLVRKNNLHVQLHSKKTEYKIGQVNGVTDKFRIISDKKLTDKEQEKISTQIPSRQLVNKIQEEKPVVQSESTQTILSYSPNMNFGNIDNTHEDMGAELAEYTPNNQYAVQTLSEELITDLLETWAEEQQQQNGRSIDIYINDELYYR